MKYIPPSPIKTIVITGGTGSFGQAFTRLLLETTTATVRIISRDEHKQADMARIFPPGPRLSYLLGDVRDLERLRVALDGADAVVHAAAFKLVPTGERQADEIVKTNIVGTDLVVRAALACRVRHALLISSDKAVSPLNLYGATKKVAEALFVHGNQLGVARGVRFAVVRGGNVWASRGSVAQMWREQRAAGHPLTVTDPEATRFHLPMRAWTSFCWQALEHMHGGEIFVPKARAWRLGDLALAFANGAGTSTAGARGGDKQHETLYSVDESSRVVDTNQAYIVEPPPELRAVWNYAPWVGACVPTAAYSSDSAPRLDRDALTQIVREIA